MRYRSHPIVDIMYLLLTTTDKYVKIRANDKDFWARNSSNPTMDVFYDFVSMSMSGCINIKLNKVLRNSLTMNFMNIPIEIK